MCDELTEKETEQFLLNGGKINRRDFSKMTAAAIMTAMLPKLAFAETVTESTVEIATPDGVSDCYFVRPSRGKHPGVVMWPDIKGLRPVYKAMGKRLAEAGYSVLVINHYYRDAKAPVVAPDASFGDPETMKFLRGLASKLTPDAITSDAKAYVSFLDAQASVDRERKIGTMGYCMGGGDSMRTAAAVPNRIGAAASFHGGELEISDGPDSTHLLIPKSPAHVLHAIAENDDKRSPETKNILTAAYKAAGVPAEIEVYEGTLHGWCTLDFAGYNEKQAEKAWGRLLHLFKVALA
ncbi:dienelactone hydrolase family protein [Thalassomonas actiniarum]|uniref:Dienelactone hydrolase family protein n=1 Tax=Thalassomonas actiniarum TaxID=485447 RepID=A0AAE9YWH2_9GAMM|nr:dienelactone hydrolase family protein [Thalassomonas actiniarum]WDE00818.1 dienelactone hydrolase family protein [Thalassomonas actiniarum]